MNFALLAPLGLAALAALALPLLIHLVRRIELRTTEFAALRWIAERVRPRRRLRFEHPWLLALRLALVAALALLLARPVWRGDARPAQAWALVAPGADIAAARAAIADPLAEWRWLAPGFPRLDESPIATGAGTASLLREADAQLPPSSTFSVAVPEQLGGLDGERPRLRHALAWHVVAGTSPVAAAANAPVRVAVRYTGDAEPSLRYLRAAVAAWNVAAPSRYTLDAQASAMPPAADTPWLVWLGGELPAPLSAWIERGGVALVTHATATNGEALWRDVRGDVLARSRALGAGREIALAGGLTPADLPLLLDADFPDRLRAAFVGTPSPPSRAPASAVQPRTIDAQQISDAHSADSIRPLDSSFALLIAALFLAERIVAARVRASA